MDDSSVRTIFAGMIVLALLVLAFLLLKPILLYIIFALILAYIFLPIYKFFLYLTRMPNLSATIVSLLLILIVVLPIWFLAPMLLEQGFKFYQSAQQVNYVEIFQQAFPSLLSSEQFAIEIGSAIQTFLTGAINSLLNFFTDLLINLPRLLLYLVVILFTFYFALRDREQLINYLKSLSPFSSIIEKKLFASSRDITTSVIYGQIVVGIIQGVVISIGFFIFGVPNALILSVAATIAGILPIVGPMFVWIPVMIYLLIIGDTFSAVGIFIFGLVASNIDNILRPLFVSRATKMHSGVVLIGMIGGLFLFGILGLIIGPLILAYVTIVLEVFRDKSVGHYQSTSLVRKGR